MKIYSNIESSYHLESRKKVRCAQGIEVSERKLALSDLKCIDWYDMDEDKNDSFVLLSQRITLTRPIACGTAIFGISKAYIVST